MNSVFAFGDVSESKPPTLKLITVVLNGTEYIPLFSNEAVFRQQTAGSDLSSRGFEIQSGFLLSVVGDDDRFVFDPGTETERRCDKTGLAALLQP